MISFRYPICFVLLELAVLLLLIWVWRRRGRNLVLPFDHGQQPRGLGKRVLLKLADSLPVLLLGVVVAILCGPTKLDQPSTTREVTNIEFCIDISGSMAFAFGEATRYDASMQALTEFLEYRDGDAFGLTFFGTGFLHFVPLTTDPSAVKYAAPYMRPENGVPVGGGTQIGKALLACRKKLNQIESGDRMIILVSDGQSADLAGTRPEDIAAQLTQDGIVLFCIHIDEASAIPEAIVTLTSLTGGEFFQPGDVEGMKAVFERIDQMKRPETKVSAAEAIDDYFPYTVAGLSLAGLTTCCLFGLRFTPW